MVQEIWRSTWSTVSQSSHDSTRRYSLGIKIPDEDENNDEKCLLRTQPNNRSDRRNPDV